MRFSFGDCLFDTETRILDREGGPVHLSPKAFQLLEYLLSERPRALSKDELHDRLWPRTHVSDATLTGLVREMRTAIGDQAQLPRFVRTIPAFGYAFFGDAAVESRRRPGPSRTYRVLCRGQEASLAEGENILGRGRESILWIDDPSVSRRHARIVIADGSVRLEDLKSKNGTFVGQRRLESQVGSVLNDRDEFRLGQLLLVYRVFTEPATTVTGLAAAGEAPGAGRETL